MDSIDATEIIKEFVDYLLPDLTPYETSILENGQNTIRVGKRTIATA
ncbi:MAG TPA: hypothetical protein VJJ75_00900 [Candidatus Nanoarchaeia archaeon]|nr:hypothetical protein [Candidatus Nanoarchaeia archaeon]